MTAGRFLKMVFGRNVVLYLAVFAVVWFSLDHDKAFIKRVNSLKGPAETHLADFEYHKETLRADQLSLAEYYFKSLASQISEQSLFWGANGFCNFYLKNYRKAIAAYEKAIAVDPMIYTYSWDLGMIYYRLGRYHEAAQYLTQSLNCLSVTVNYYDQLMETEKKERGDDNTVKKIARLKERARADEKKAIHFLAQCFFQIGQFEKMRDIGDRGLAAYPDSALYFFDIGQGYFLTRQFKEGEHYFTRAIAADPAYLNAYIYRQQAREMLGDKKGYREDKEMVKRLEQQGATREDAFELHSNIDLIRIRYQQP